MSLPKSRNTNYGQGVQIESKDLNDLQDSIIGAKRGVVEEFLGLGCIYPNVSNTSFSGWELVDHLYLRAASGSGGGASIDMSLGRFPEGARIVDCGVVVKDLNGSAFAITVHQYDLDSESYTELVPSAASDASGNVQKLWAGLSSEVTVRLLGKRLSIEIDSAPELSHLYGPIVKWYLP